MSAVSGNRPRGVGTGEWLFRRRGWIPVPLILLAIAVTNGVGLRTMAGLFVVLLGWGIRIWAVAHIGPGSRTRGDEVDRLTYTGPYELSRNPIYVANLVIYAGLGLMTQRLAMVLLLCVCMLVHYSFIIRWEEWNLQRRLGEAYRSYLNRVPRWFGPSAPVHAAAHKISAHDRWPAALRSEQSTLIAVGAVAVSILIRGALGV